MKVGPRSTSRRCDVVAACSMSRIVPGSPFSYPIEAVALPPKGRAYAITAPAANDARASAAIALGAVGLESMDELKGQLSVSPAADGTTEVTGTFSARVVQACVVTLAPVPATIDRSRSTSALRRRAAGATLGSGDESRRIRQRRSQKCRRGGRDGGGLGRPSQR